MDPAENPLGWEKIEKKPSSRHINCWLVDREGKQIILKEAKTAIGHRLIFNEYLALNRLAGTGLVPEIEATNLLTSGRRSILEEYIPWPSLESLVKDKQVNQAEIAPLMIKLVQAIKKIHQSGIIHRDLKPAHIMIGPKNEIKLIDFGTSNCPREKYCDLILGDPNLADDDPRVNEKERDFYRLGMIAYFCFSGKMPAGTSLNAKEKTIINEKTQTAYDLLIQAKETDYNLIIEVFRALQRGNDF